MSAGSRQSGGFTDVDRVREATDLLALVGEHVALKPRGREHVGLCPFHDDRTPSFSVVTHKGDAFYKCHACGAAGDAFKFVMEYHRKDFVEALRFLADRAGIELQGSSGARRSTDGPDRGELRKANAAAVRFFQRTLADSASGKLGRNALAERGVDPAMIELFQIGAAPEGYTGLAGALGDDARVSNAFAAAGLLKRRDDGSHYDAFRNRLIFPICDELGHAIAFGGRRLREDDEPKYLNSPESAVFHKSRTLYGLHLAKRSIIDSKQAIVVEGYTDVVACHQAGVTNVIGTLGTALTDDHARLLSRLCDSVVLVFDGDEAGQRAADRGVQVFFGAPVDIRICVLPDALDPDDLLRQDDGVDRFMAAVDAATDALGFKVDRFSGALTGATTIAAREKLLAAFLQELADLGFNGMPGVRKRWVLARLAELLNVSIADIEQSMPRARRAAPAPAIDDAPAASGDQAPLDLDGGLMISRARRVAERDLLSVLVVGSEAAAAPIAIDGADPAPVHELFTVEDFRDPAARAIAEIVLDFLGRGRSFTVPQVLGALDDPTHRKVASDLYFEGARRCGEEGESASTALVDAASALHRCRRDEQYRRHVASTVPSQASPDQQVAALSAVLEKRRAQGHMAAAITRGGRS